MGNADWVRGYFIGVDNGWGYGDIKPKINIKTWDYHGNIIWMNYNDPTL